MLADSANVAIGENWKSKVRSQKKILDTTSYFFYFFREIQSYIRPIYIFPVVHNPFIYNNMLIEDTDDNK